MSRVLYTLVFLFLGELFGIGVFLYKMHVFGTRLSFSQPITFVDLMNYALLVLCIVIVPACIAKVGNRLVDAYFREIS
jgi:hypothetical protein